MSLDLRLIGLLAALALLVACGCKEKVEQVVPAGDPSAMPEEKEVEHAASVLTAGEVWRRAAPFVPGNWVAISVAGSESVRDVLHTYRFFDLPEEQKTYASKIRALAGTVPFDRNVAPLFGGMVAVTYDDNELTPMVLVGASIPVEYRQHPAGDGGDEQRVWQYLPPLPLFGVSVPGFGQAVFADLKQAERYAGWLHGRSNQDVQEEVSFPPRIPADAVVVGSLRVTAAAAFPEPLAELLADSKLEGIWWWVRGDEATLSVTGPDAAIQGVAERALELQSAAEGVVDDWESERAARDVRAALTGVSILPWVKAAVTRFVPDGTAGSGQLAWRLAFEPGFWLDEATLFLLPVVPGWLRSS